MRRMVDRKVVDPGKIRTIYKSQTFPTTGFGLAYNLDPTLAAKIRQAFFTFEWEGSALKAEFEKSGEGKFISIVQCCTRRQPDYDTRRYQGSYTDFHVSNIELRQQGSFGIIKIGIWAD